ncbi:putative GRIP domain Golgi protein, partial [Reticulomyxa filosa]
DSENKNIQIEALLKQKQQWEEKEKELKKSQNHLQQESLKFRVDFELLKRDFIEKEKQMIGQNNQATKSLQEKDEQIDRLSKQNSKYQDESNQLKLEIDELKLKIKNSVIDADIGQLKKQIQNKDDEIDVLKQDFQLKIMEIVEKEERIQQLEREIEILKKDSILIRNSQRLDEQNKEEEQKQPDNQDVSLPVSAIFNFEMFRTSSKLLKTLNGHTGN